MPLNLIVKMPNVVGYYFAIIHVKNSFVEEVKACAKKVVEVFHQDLIDGAKATEENFEIFDDEKNAPSYAFYNGEIPIDFLQKNATDQDGFWGAYDTEKEFHREKYLTVLLIGKHKSRLNSIAIEDVFSQELRYELGKRYLNNELCFP